MKDVKVDRIDITIEVDHTEGEAAFAKLFQKYMRRWQEAESQRRADKSFAESERVIPGAGP